MMAAPKATPFVTGKRRGTIYDFAHAGDILPWHEHDETTDHMTIVASGSFIGRGQGWSATYKAPDVLLDLPSPHEFEALETNSRLVNILKF